MKHLNAVLTEVASNGNVKFPIIENQVFLQTPIENLDLDTRSFNSLKRAKIDDIQGILENLDNIHKFKGCGVKSANRILYKICATYYEFVDDKESYLNQIKELNQQKQIKN